MRLVHFADGGTIRLGTLLDGAIIDLSDLGFRTIADVILGGEVALQHVRDATAAARRVLPLEEETLRNPLPTPSKVVAVGLNYPDHCREQGVAPPPRPLVFGKFPSSVIGPGEPITWDPRLTSQVDPEIELGVVIGTRARNVSPDHALGHVFGYTIVNDVSARDLQAEDGQWTRAKSVDSFCPVGPAIVTRDAIPDPRRLAMELRVDDWVQQSSSTSEMIFSIADIIAYTSRFATLEPGDLLLTGTPWGVGHFRSPPVYLQGGEVVSCTIEGLGTLRNPTVARAAREPWG